MPDEPTPAEDAPETLQRRLATILSADVAGYSRLMGEHEEATVQALRGHRAVFEALLKQHRGRVFNTAGDAILAEFPSAVEAVRCATEIQSALQTRNEHLPPAQKMLFRMGINIGDVVVQGNDLLGDGVNVAARIQTLAEPGGICIAGSVYDQIQNKLSLQFKPLGEQQFKNIGQKVRTFTITHGERGALPSALHRMRRKSALALGAAALLAGLAAGGYLIYRDYETKRVEQNALAAQLATERKAAEDARRTAEEQSRRAAEAEAKADRERLVAEAAKREAILQAQVQSAEEARRHAEADRKRIEEERRRADEEKRLATAQAEEAKRAAEAQAEESRKKRLAGTFAQGTSKAAAPGLSQPTKLNSDGNYNGLLCNFPNNPTKRACWRVDLKVQNGTGTGSWSTRQGDKTASVHATIDSAGVATLMLDGWNMNAGTPLAGTLNGRLVGDHLDAEGQWANGLRIAGHWTRAP